MKKIFHLYRIVIQSMKYFSHLLRQNINKNSSKYLYAITIQNLLKYINFFQKQTQDMIVLTSSMLFLIYDYLLYWLVLHTFRIFKAGSQNRNYIIFYKIELFQRMLRIVIAIILLTQTHQNTILGPNLLINNDFSQPSIYSQGQMWIYINEIPGWTCLNSCQYYDCELMNQDLYQYDYSGSHGFLGDCHTQVLDLSSDSIQEVSQVFQAFAGRYILSLKFLLPATKPTKKILVVLINDIVVFKYHPQMPTYEPIERQVQVVLLNSKNKITLTMEGLNDTCGFPIMNVQIKRKVNNIADKIIENSINSTFLSSIVAIPGCRILFGEFLNVLMSLDRMQLYYYHHRNYSYYYTEFIKGIDNLLNQKGVLTLIIGQKMLQTFQIQPNQIFDKINYKKNRKYKDGYATNGLIENEGLFFIEYIPIIVLMFLVLHFFFKTISSYKQSKFFRKYSFVSLLLLILVEGNIEQFSFFIFDQFMQFFSKQCKHKIVNLFILIVFYMIVFCSTAFYFCCWYHYRKKIVYLTENVNMNVSGFFAATLDKGLFCLILGATHRLLIMKSDQQLIALGCIQMLWITSKISFIVYSQYKLNLYVWIHILQGFIRICFIFSIYNYEKIVNMRPQINQSIHLKIIYAFLLIWAINYIYSVLNILNEAFFISKLTQCQVIYHPNSLPLEDSKKQKRFFLNRYISKKLFKFRFKLIL